MLVIPLVIFSIAVLSYLFQNAVISLTNIGKHIITNIDSCLLVMNVKTVDTFYMMGYVVKAIQELSEQIQKLKDA